MPVAAVIAGGSPTHNWGSSTANFGIRHRSIMAYLWLVSVSVIRAAIVVSLPVPAVVGTAIKRGSFLNTFKRPPS